MVSRLRWVEIHLETVLATPLPLKLAWPLIRVKLIVRLVLLGRCQMR